MQFKTYRPPEPAERPNPPGSKPKGIDQGDDFNQHSNWGAIARVVPRTIGGVPMQTDFWGRANWPKGER